ncbi:hypothetical protein [Lactiplantibacillus plantarum]|uniref:hypothetical protein n=1 Tax=Lactiplantibacillus plantarum TaxID=1590 RepID=UPI00097621B3|nr:hypothetical protein [Lactiplantibacillus plantarum]
MKKKNEIDSYKSVESTFYITNILSHSDILMRGGSDKDIQKGDYFYILDEPTKIIDPYTKKILGRTFQYKYMMQVVEVLENVSRLTTTEKTNLSRRSSENLLNRRKPVRIDPNQDVSDVLSDFSYSAIKVGDILVRDANMLQHIKYRPNSK